MREFKATREFLKKFNPPPESSPMPPANYSSDFLTKEETDYINDISKKIMDKVFENFNKNRKYSNGGKRKHCTLNCKEVLDGFN